MSQEIQSDPSDHQHEHESEAILNPESVFEAIKRGWQDFFQGKQREERENYLETYLPLYEASIRCDWKAAEDILDKKKDMELVRCKITENGETALHIAASAKAPKNKVDEFVKNLVERMTPEDLELVNNNHNTALYLAAAAGNIESVKIMMKKNPALDTIPGGGGDMMPLYAAVLFGHKDVAEYLYESSKYLTNVRWNDLNRSQFLEKCVESDMFDIALKIVTRYLSVGRTSIILQLLARKPEAFHEKKSSNITEYNIIRRTIMSGLRSQSSIQILISIYNLLCEVGIINETVTNECKQFMSLLPGHIYSSKTGNGGSDR